MLQEPQYLTQNLPLKYSSDVPLRAQAVYSRAYYWAIDKHRSQVNQGSNSGYNYSQ